MGITAEEILRLIIELKDSVTYWKTCQPFLVTAELENNIVRLECQLTEIIEKQNNYYGTQEHFNDIANGRD